MSLELGQPKGWPKGFAIPGEMTNIRTGEKCAPKISYVGDEPCPDELLEEALAHPITQQRGGVYEGSLCGKNDDAYETERKVLHTTGDWR